MPEVGFTVRWPDGVVQEGWSPSTVIEQALAVGGAYPVGEFLRRVRAALELGSERVRARYGMACTAAMEQLAELEAGAAAHGARAGVVVVESLARLPGAPAFPAPARLPSSVPVVVVGGGQAGLSVSWCLAQRGIEHIVLERARVAHRWRTERWDSFCLVTPNWQCRLPGMPLGGVDPDGFIRRDEIAAYVEGYAATFDLPVCEEVPVTRIAPAAEGGFLVATTRGDVHASQVVLAVGGYHVPRYPAAADALGADIGRLHSSTYRNAAALPDGAVLVVGSGQSGAQIAEDLLLAGREVHLAVGTAPRVARFHRGRDVVAWLEDMGHYDLTVQDHPQGAGARREANHYVTGRDGGRDIDLRAHAAAGMRLHGRLLGFSPEGVATFAGDLAANLDAADATYARINAGIDRWIAANGIDAPAGAPYAPVWSPAGDGSAPLDLAAAGIRTIVWATGFSTDWSWVEAPGFGTEPHPGDHVRGVTSTPGLHVVGLPWLHTWGSGRFAGIARDAEHVAGAVAERAEAALRPAA